MKAIHLSAHLPRSQPLISLKPTTIPEPRLPSHGTTPSALVLITHASPTHVDTLYARGLHQNNRSLVVPPFILGMEFSGVVLAVSAKCRLSPGDEVFGAHPTGAFAERIVVPAESLRRIPQGWSRREASGLATTLPVAYGGLVRVAKIQKGDVVLVHGASGGIGAMAVQIAKASGCGVIATTRGEKKSKWLRTVAEADVVIDINQQGWEVTVRREAKRLRESMQKSRALQSGPQKAEDNDGVDVTFDNVGLIEQSIRCSRYAGRILICGFVGRGGVMEKVAMNKVLLKGVTVIGYRYGETNRMYPDEAEIIWRACEDMMRKRQIKSIVQDEDYAGLEQAGRALTAMEAGDIFGKCVIKVQDLSDQLDGLVSPKL